MEPIDEYEAQEMRVVLGKFYGPATVQHWTINYEVYELLGKLISETRTCTKAMHLVPRPYDLSGPLKWAQKQVRQAVVRYLTAPENQFYIACMNTAARNMRTPFEIAGTGI